jgi:hypothetical protein
MPMVSVFTMTMTSTEEGMRDDAVSADGSDCDCEAGVDREIDGVGVSRGVDVRRCIGDCDNGVGGSDAPPGEGKGMGSMATLLLVCTVDMESVLNEEERTATGKCKRV